MVLSSKHSLLANYQVNSLKRRTCAWSNPARAFMMVAWPQGPQLMFLPTPWASFSTLHFIIANTDR